MYAVVKTGGKQYRVSAGDRITVEKLAYEKGSSVKLDVLLLVDGSKVVNDADALAKASVTAEVVEHFRGEKAVIFKFKKRKNYKRLRGHRQELTRLLISEVAEEESAPKKRTARASSKASKLADEEAVEAVEVEESEEAIEVEAAEVTEVEEVVEADEVVEAADEADEAAEVAEAVDEVVEAEEAADEAEPDADTESDADAEPVEAADEPAPEAEAEDAKPARSRRKKDDAPA